MKALLLLSLFLVFTLQAMAQGRTVTGTVSDEATNQGLPGVAVLVQGTTVGTTTGADGTYTLTVPEGNNTLTFRFIGYTPVTRNIDNASTIDVALSVDTKQLNEVVVTAFGIEREEKALSYSVQQVEGEAVSRAGQPNVTNGIQGKVAGVIVRQSSGLPGSSSTITIRGNRSFLGNNQPLYVVDGMPIESNSLVQDPNTGQGPGTGGVSGADASSRALDINPNDIESISVLKGGAAAALYGLRASNGVVIITTKKGKGLTEKKGATITFNTDYTFDEVSRLPDLQSTYAQGSAGAYSNFTSLSWGPQISTLGDVTDRLGNTRSGNQIFDNVDPFFQTGHTWNNNINIGNSGPLGNYAVGFGYTDQEGIVPTTGMSRYTAKLAGDFNLNEKITLGISANYSDVNVDKIPGGSNLSNPLFTLYAAPRTFDLWGSPFNFPGEPYRQYNYRSAIDNPRWSLENNEFTEQTRRIIGSGTITYRPLEWVALNYRFGVDFFTTDGKEVYELGSGNTGGAGLINDFTNNQNQINSNISVNFNRNVTEDLSLNLLLGNEVYDIRSRLISNFGSGIPIGGFRNIGSTASQRSTDFISRRRVAGFYASLEAGFRDYLFLNATARQDYVSNLPRDNRSFFYPSIGLGFVFTDAFGIENNWLSFGKIRASYAEVGQAPDDPYQTRNFYLVGSSTSGFLEDDIQFPFNGLPAYSASDILRTDQLRPQNTKTVEVGGDFRFLDNRLTVDYTYYIQTTEDQIFQVPVAPTSGFTSELRNAGELESKGHELVVGIIPVRNPNFQWELTTNFSSFENEVKSLAPGVENIFLGGFTIPNVRAEAGAPYPVIFGASFVRDDAGNIVVDSRESIEGDPNPYYGMPLEGPAKAIGSVQPDFEMNFLNSLNFKGITLTAQLDWRKGGKAYAGNTRLLKLYGMAEITEDRETPKVFEGSKGFFDEEGNLVVEGSNDIAVPQGQTFWQTAMDIIDESNVYSTTFVRLREVTFGYTIPTALVEKTPFQSASVFLTGRNLFLITDYPNFDPETSVGGAGNFQGLEYVSLPQTRSFGAGIRVSF
ncbi:SusC/RagA family TonB-linked outer membrane protein [Pontibacter sp. HJ8]